MNKKIVAAFKKYNIDAFGITDASLVNSALNSDYKSVIVALFPYFCGYEEKSDLSIYTHGRDYHLVAGEILEKVSKEIGFKESRIGCDIGPEIEKELAVRSGLCFKGRNGLCINEKYGSYFFIGYIACREDFEKSTFSEKNCIGCMKCVNACPGGALDSGFDKNKCLSEITQKKGVLTDFEEKLIYENPYVFGCDICQKVCPHNENAQKTTLSDFIENRITNIELSDIEKITNKQFKEKYGDRAFSWRGKSVIERNLKIKENYTCKNNL